MQKIKILSLLAIGMSLGLAANAGESKKMVRDEVKSPSANVDASHSTDTAIRPEHKTTGSKTTSSKANWKNESFSDQTFSKTQIKDAQRSLNTYGYELQVDGVIGTETRNAIRQFQENRNLERTGELNSSTMAALTGSESAINEEGRQPASVDSEPVEEDMPEMEDEEEMNYDESMDDDEANAVPGTM